jgi:hypothetical protein
MTLQQIAVRLVEFVLRDARYKEIGLRGALTLVFRDSEGLLPTPAQRLAIRELFWEEHDRRSPARDQTRVPHRSRTYLSGDR